ncbi:MAG: GyrI-like domain-containing protein [bacterium]|nr:GyrI-like domain-containing protein [bacterium]
MTARDQKHNQQYIARIHKVQDYIEEHIGQAMSTEELADAAGFSKYHFSRIFGAILHEPLAHYVTRIRMERAVFFLAHRQDKNMTEIAYELGFSDSAVFSRAFKNFYGVSPKEYRSEYRTNCKEPFLLSEYNKDAAKKKTIGSGFPVTGEITIKRMEEKILAYVRHTGTYECLAKEYPSLIETLFSYAEKQHLLQEGENDVLAMYHDNPEFGEETQFRTSLCITVPEGMPLKEDGVLGKMRLEGGLYAVGHFHIRQEEYKDAWNYMYQEWLTCSDYMPRNCAPFECYLNPYGEIQEVEIYVPIEPI